jgi:hypothetical protein
MRLFQCLAVLLFASAAWGQPPADLVRQLREGGYVLYMRHASTDFSQNDSRMTSVGEVALAFGKARAMSEVRGGPVRSDDPNRYEGLRRLLGTPPKGKTNNVISSHGNPFQAVAGSPYLAEGEIAVVRPEGGTRFTVVARIRPEDWSGLRDAAGPAS